MLYRVWFLTALFLVSCTSQNKPAEPVSSSAELQLGAAGVQSASPMHIPKDYIQTPNGWVHPSCHKEIPSLATVDAEHDDVYVDGKLWAHYDPCKYPSIPTGGPSGGNIAQSNQNTVVNATTNGAGWWGYTAQRVYNGSMFQLVWTNFTVPQNPITPTGTEGIAYFSGLQSVEGPCGIMQPMVFYGKPTAGSPEIWRMNAQLFYSSRNGYSGPAIQVYPDDKITLSMQWRPDVYPGKYEILTRSTRTGQTSDIFVQPGLCVYDWVAPTAFELMNAGATNCAQVPHSAIFVDISLWAGALPNNAPVTYQHNTGILDPLGCGLQVVSGTTYTGANYTQYYIPG